jgi:hypothetical protein
VVGFRAQKVSVVGQFLACLASQMQIGLSIREAPVQQIRVP